MADGASPLAPLNPYPERVSNTFEVGVGASPAGTVGPTRFEEGLATDPSVPGNFMTGIANGYVTAPGRSNHNDNVYEKPAAETMQSRLHPGSAAWTSAPEFLGAFAAGCSPEGERRFIAVTRPGTNQKRRNEAEVTD
jgi:hypothetical protein